MKKMQCEVCGSNEIKKVGDGVFECQSCGVQYSKEEVQKLLVEITGKVKIDHTDEVQNNIKRGNQYEQSGNPAKAKEYYNKALDLDADNVEAQENIKKASEMQQFDKYYIIEPDVNPEDNVKDFLKQLAATENIACDIYKEISIKNVTEKFYTFLFMKGKYKCDWSLTACHRYYENETVYTEKYDPKTNKRYKEPETKKVERIERVPMHGTEVYDAEQLVLGSNSLNKDISCVSESLVNPLIADFEQLQNNKYSEYTSKRIDPKTVEKENGIYKYCGIPLDLKVENSVYNTRKNEMKDSADQKAVDEVIAGLNCDFFEGVSATGMELSQTVAYICLPVQIIEYTYKGKTYIAVSDLLSYTTTMPMTYPCDVELADSMSELNTQKDKVKKSHWYLPGLVICGISLLFLLLGMITDAQEGPIIPLMMISGLAGLIAILVGGIVQYMRTKKYQQNATDIKKSLFDPRVSALEEGKTRFFKEYSDYASAQSAASNMDCIAISSIRPELSFAGQIRKKAYFAYDTNDANNVEEDDTLAILQYGVKAYKRKRNIGLCLTFFIGALLGTIGIVLFGSYNFWYYTLWGIAMLLCVGGFGIALVGSIVIMAKFNSKISDLMSCVTVHTARLRIEQGIEQASIPGMIKWTPERIAEKAAQISEQKEKTRLQKEARKNEKIPQVIVAWLKKHIKPIIILPCVILALVLSVVIEIMAVNHAAKPYEESLYGKTFTRIIESVYYEGTETYTFFDDNTYDNTYEYSQKDISLDNGEPQYSFSREGSYAVRFELFSGEPFLSFDNYTYSRYTIRTDSDEQIYAFEAYRDYYSLSDGEDSANSKEDPNNSTTSDNNSGETSASSGSLPSGETGNDSSANTSTGDHTNVSDNVNDTTCAKGHTWKEATCTEPATCTVCGITTGSAKGHTWKEATCTEPAICAVCGITSGSANGHDWVAITQTVHHDATGHYETVTDAKKVNKYKCPLCNKKYDSIEEYYLHFDSVHENDFLSEVWRERYETVEAWEYYDTQQWVVDSEAYDETVITGYRCSICGQTK